MWHGRGWRGCRLRRGNAAMRGCMRRLLNCDDCKGCDWFTPDGTIMPRMTSAGGLALCRRVWSTQCCCTCRHGDTVFGRVAIVSCGKKQHSCCMSEKASEENTAHQVSTPWRSVRTTEHGAAKVNVRVPESSYPTPPPLNCCASKGAPLQMLRCLHVLSPSYGRHLPEVHALALVASPAAHTLCGYR